jgi:hypothetical protein
MQGAAEYSSYQFLIVRVFHSSLTAAHIRVERRRKGKKRPNVYVDDRGHPDWQQDWDWLQEENYGQVLSKWRRFHDMRKEPVSD